jgi:hypothetical protein
MLLNVNTRVIIIIPVTVLSGFHTNNIIFKCQINIGLITDDILYHCNNNSSFKIFLITSNVLISCDMKIEK